MKNTIVSYDTHHGSARRIAERIASNLWCDYLDIDTPFKIEDLTNFDNIIIVFGFRGPYTAQLTKLYLSRAKTQFKGKNVFLIGEGMFSEKEFPGIAEEIKKLLNEPQTFSIYFIKGQLRVNELTSEERHMLDEFSKITGMKIVDMGELNLEDADRVSEDIKRIINENPVTPAKEESEETEWVCPACGYVHKGDNPPDKCPWCGLDGSKFKKK